MIYSYHWMWLTKVKSGFLNINDTWNANRSKLFHHQLPQSFVFLPCGIPSRPLACCLSWRREADTRLCAREGTGGPEVNSSQRAGQLGTSRPFNHPAAGLNLQFCSAVRLKEAAWRAHLSVAWSDLIFLGWWWEGIGGLRGWLDSLSVLWFEDHRGRLIRDTCLIRWREQRSRAICMMGLKQPGSFNLSGCTVQGHRQPHCAAFNSPGNTPISWKITIRRCWVL